MLVVTFVEVELMYLMDSSTARTTAIMTFVETAALGMNKVDKIFSKTAT